jgi:predicted small lipoprotein YifL
MRLISMLLFVVFLLAACGKKGDLYLPAPAQPVATQSTPSK